MLGLCEFYGFFLFSRCFVACVCVYMLGFHGANGCMCRFMASSKVLGEETVKGGGEKGREEK